MTATDPTESPLAAQRGTDQRRTDPLLDPAALDVLRSKIVDEVAAGRMPAVQMAFAADGDVILSESFGSADDTTPFNVFSCTKAFIAGVVWQLIGEGSLSPSTLAIDLIPELGTHGRTPEWMAAVTLEQLMTHTGGFPAAPLGPPEWDTRAGRLQRYARWRCAFEPGTHFEYHPVAGHWLIADMIEAIEGRDFRDVVTDRILAPLGLSSTHLGGDAGAESGVAELVLTGEEPAGEPAVGDGGVTSALLVVFNDPSIRRVGVPGGGAVSTASDLARCYQAMLHNPDQRWEPDVLADATSTIRCSLINAETGASANRCLGLAVAGDDGNSILRGMGACVGPRTFGHNGAGGQIAWADPDTGISFALTTSALELDPLLEARRIASLASKAGACMVPDASGAGAGARAGGTGGAGR